MSVSASKAAGSMNAGKVNVRVSIRNLSEWTQTFCQASGDLNPLHVDEAYARRTGFGRCIVHGMAVVQLMLDVLYCAGAGANAQGVNASLCVSLPESKTDAANRRQNDGLRHSAVGRDSDSEILSSASRARQVLRAEQGGPEEPGYEPCEGRTTSSHGSGTALFEHPGHEHRTATIRNGDQTTTADGKSAVAVDRDFMSVGRIEVEFRNAVFPEDELQITWDLLTTDGGKTDEDTSGSVGRRDSHEQRVTGRQTSGEALEDADGPQRRRDRNSRRLVSSQARTLESIAATTSEPFLGAPDAANSPELARCAVPLRLRGVAETTRGVAVVVHLSFYKVPRWLAHISSAQIQGESEEPANDWANEDVPRKRRADTEPTQETALDKDALVLDRTSNDAADGGEARAIERNDDERDEPWHLTLDELSHLSDIRGTYDHIGTAFTDRDSEYVALQRLLGLCSYLVGMRMPGERALFVRGEIEWVKAACEANGHPLQYRLSLDRADEQLRLVHCSGTVEDDRERTLATLKLRSYVRVTPYDVPVEILASYADALRPALAGKVALVCGASRGLGAEIAALLALAGARVHGVYRSSSTEADRLNAALASLGVSVTFHQANAGDPQAVARLLDIIRRQYGRVDMLVLNACEQPRPGLTGCEFAEYVSSNLRLVTAPLEAALEALKESRGTVTLVSSSYVRGAPAGLGAYVALKKAAEDLVRSYGEAVKDVTFQIARPPRLQTRWNDSPAAIAGAIPSWCAAVSIVKDYVDHISRAEPRRQNVFLTEDFPLLAARRKSSRSKQVSIAIGATFTAEPVRDALESWADHLGWDLRLAFTGYNQVVQELLNPTGHFASNTSGVNVAFVRVRDWLREHNTDSSVSEILDEAGSHLLNALSAYSRAGRPPLVLIVTPCELNEPHADDEVICRWERRLIEAARSLPGIHVLDAKEWHPVYGLNKEPGAYYDPQRDAIGHIPYRPHYYRFLATLAVRRVFRFLTPAKKVVVVDCDNTLWRGVVGEVGSEGVVFEPHHLKLQRRLAELADSGVLVCLCSKNQEEDVWAVFERRADEMPLKRDHIVAAAINWEPKSQNLTRLANALNLGRDSFVFIDDNPVECAEVRARCPDVLTLEWPQETDRAIRLLQHIWELDPLPATTEDRKRTRMYREEFQRQQLKSQARDFREFLQSLELRLDFRPLCEEDIPRASQLTLRTNQFNFTTIRRSEAEIRELLTDPASRCWTVRVSDRFGDYGLVGLIIARLRSQEHEGTLLDVDTFLLSCRVLGRGVEHKIVAFLAQQALNLGAEKLAFRISFTRKNLPAQNFLRSIVPEDLLTSSEDSLSCIIPARDYVNLEYAPDEGVDRDTSAEDNEQKSKNDEDVAAGNHAAHVREREKQIFLTAFEYSALEEEEPAQDREGSGRPDAAAPLSEVRARVLEAFASQLRMAPDEIERIDRLDQLGCDSFKIVEITVALLQHYPHLPVTLLFEHQTVSDIIQAVTAATRPSAPALPEVAPRTAPESRPATDTDIAIVGMSLRCAGARSPEELWDLLRGGKSAVGEVRADRPHFLGRLEGDRKHWAGLLEDPDRFDAAFFGISPREAAMLDPQLRLLLEVAWEALEDAGWCEGPETEATGVFIGVMYADYVFAANQWAEEQKSLYRCWEGFSLANRLSQILGFRGPSLAIDTACSSSGTALYAACRALAAGDCKAAVVGGVNLILDPNRFSQLGRLGILSPDGRCRPFGDEANGTVLGEGAIALVLMPLSEARRRGARILGVIRGIGVSHGTGTVGFTAPNPQAQAVAIREALRSARIDPRTVSFVETHGTGTALGDPIEIRGLQLAYDDPALHCEREIAEAAPIRLGAIKPNTGHLEAGAALMGIAKVLLQLQHGELVPTITSTVPSRHIPWDQTRFRVQREVEPWARPRLRCTDGSTREYPRRAGVSSFGVGGSNVHVILEEPPEPANDGAAEAARAERACHVVALSARSNEALCAYAERVASWLERNPEEGLADVCYSLATGRKHFEHRLAVACRNSEECVRLLRRLAKERRKDPGRSRVLDQPRVAFLFTGQGAQYVGMGRQLYRENPTFRRLFDKYVSLVNEHLDRPLQEVMFAEPGSEEERLLTLTTYTQPALFALQLALADLWKYWGVQPLAVCGHSVGEIAAMVVAGGLSPADGAALVCARGRLMGELPRQGAMAVIAADEATVAPLLEPGVSIAALNSPKQTVISGSEDAVRKLLTQFEACGVRTTLLNVSHAFHSHLMEPILEPFRQAIQSLRFRRPDLSFVSTATGRREDEDVTRPDYWIEQIRRPVRFVDAARHILSDSDVVIEIGPHPVLVALAKTLPESNGKWFVPSLARKEPDTEVIARGVATLYEKGLNIKWQNWDGDYFRRRVRVPTYPFKRESYWINSCVRISVEPQPQVDRFQEPGEDARLETYGIHWKKWDAPEKRPGNARFLVLGSDSAAQVASEIRDSGIDAHACRNLAEATRLLGEDSEVRVKVLDLRFLEASITPGDVPRLLSRLGSELASGDLFDAAERLEYWLVTSGGCAVTVGDRVDPCQAALWGFLRSAALELRRLRVGLADNLGATWALVANAVANAGDEDQIAIRDARIWVPRLGRVPIPEILPGHTVDPEKVYVITGGSGWLGGHAARRLAELGARHIWLVSRRATVPEELKKELSNLGAEVRPLRADLGHEEAVNIIAAEIRATGRRLGGLIHAAGADRPEPLARLSRQAIEDVWNPKAMGAWLLCRLVEECSPDFICLFSSLASVVGAATRSHYAAANAFLDGLSFWLNARGVRAVSISWGPWAGGGMADESTIRNFERVGNYAIQATEGAEVLGAILASASAPHVCAARIAWERFARAYESRRKRPLIQELVRETTDGATGFGTESSEGAGSLREAVLGAVCGALGYDTPSAVPLDADLTQLGLDSLIAADVLSRLRRVVELPATFSLFEYGTVGELLGAVEETAAWRSHQGGDAADTESGLLDRLRSVAAQSLGSSAEAVPVDRPLRDLGMDSLLVTDFLARVERTLGRRPPMFAFESMSLADLAASLEKDTGGKASSKECKRVAQRGVERFSEGQEAAVFEFCRKAWPDRAAHLIEPRWRWMFLESARRVGVEPAVWLYRENGQVLGHMGAIPVRLKVEDQEVTTAWFVDTMVLEEARAVAAGTMITIAAIDDMPFSLSLGQTPYVREMLRRLGWRDVCPLKTYVYVLDAFSLASRRLGNSLLGAAGGAVLRAKQWWHGAPRSRWSRDVRVEQVDDYGPEQDELWQRVTRCYRIAVVRDRSFMNWKYVRQPGQDFTRIHVWCGDRLAGTAVVAFREPGQVYRYRRAFLVDLVVDARDTDACQTVLGAVVEVARERNAALLIAYLTNELLESQLRLAGFWEREPQRFLLVRPDGAPVDPEVLTDGSRWLLTMGDSDIDRPGQ